MGPTDAIGAIGPAPAMDKMGQAMAATAGAAAGGAHEVPRILRTYVAARAALGLALLLLPWATAVLVGGHQPLPSMLVNLAYAAQAVSLWLVLGGEGGAASRPEGLHPRRWLSTIGVDLLAFALLRLLDPVSQLNFAALLVLPVLMAGVLMPRLPALATAASASLVLLAGAGLDGQGDSDALLRMSQAGLAGAGMFLISLMAGELSQRLAGEAQSARHSLELARQQTQLNRVVIEEMTEGVLVVDRQARLRAINPAALQLLGLAGQRPNLPCPMDALPVLGHLRTALHQAYGLGRWPESAREQTLVAADGSARAVQVRARFTRRHDIGADGTPPEDIGVLFLEDLRTVRARQRQDKLAAMGRVSAGIAHEIRNPLAAIAQANALMREDPLPVAQQRLARIVADNVDRLKRIVDDVMAVAPGGVYEAVVIDAAAETRRICDDWLRTAPAEAQAARRLQRLLPAQPLAAQFDAEHLRRVLVNLLDNALRHAGPDDGAVRLSLGHGPGGLLRLVVASDGEPMPAEVERHLFEPFSSSRSRGSGLGLYICRELCERHGASIEYLRGAADERHRNVFSVWMRPADGASPAR